MLDGALAASPSCVARRRLVVTPVPSTATCASAATVGTGVLAAAGVLFRRRFPLGCWSRPRWTGRSRGRGVGRDAVRRVRGGPLRPGRPAPLDALSVSPAWSAWRRGSSPPAPRRSTTSCIVARRCWCCRPCSASGCAPGRELRRRAAGPGRAGRVRAAAAGAGSGAGRAGADHPGDARRGRAPGEPDGAAGRRDRHGRRRPGPGPAAGRPAAGRRPPVAGGAAPAARAAPATTRTPRSRPQPTLADLDELVERLPPGRRRRHADPAAARPRELDPTVGRTAYRVVQEALTNAGKHAPGGPVAVTLDLRRGRARGHAWSTGGRPGRRPRCPAAGWA